MSVTRFSRLKGLMLMVGALLILSVFGAACGEEGPKPTIRVSDQQFESLWINTAIFKFVVENGYGYPVETVELTTPLMQVALAQGDVDVTLEMWQQNFIDNYNEEIAKGSYVNLGPTYEGGPQFFIIPKATADWSKTPRTPAKGSSSTAR